MIPIVWLEIKKKIVQNARGLDVTLAERPTNQSYRAIRYMWTGMTAAEK